MINMKKLVILDSNSLLNRAFYALPPMTNSKGIHTNAIYGFTTMLFKIINDIKPDYIAAAFDKSRITFRNSEYAEYKAGRKKMPDELAEQFEPLKKLLSAFNIGIYEIANYEADDIIGTISKRFESPEMQVTIYTGDRDSLQLVSDYTNVIITKKGISETELYNREELKKRYGLTPERMIDLKGLMGDASDNIPGVAGVGEKTALKLLNEYDSLENVYENIEKISGKKLKESLALHKDMAFLSKRIATIYRDVPVEVNLNDIEFKNYNPIKINELFIEYEFKSLMNRIKVDSNDENNVLKNINIAEYDGDKNILNKIINKKEFNFIFIYAGKDLKCMAIDDDYIVKSDYIKDFKEIFESKDIIKNTFEAKKAINYLKKINISVNSLNFDAEIAAYLLNPSESSYDVINLLRRYENISIVENSDIKAALIFIQNMDDIKEKILSEIKEKGMYNLFTDIEMPLIEVLSGMEITGFRVDVNILHQIGFELSEEIDKLTAEIYDDAGEEFNINSPKQLGIILFEKLNLPVIKKTKTGYSTDANVLEELSDKNEIIDKILSYRQLMKLKSTYIEGLMTNIQEDGRIHSSFNQTVTATGRISSTEPNLQNIPVKMEMGRQIRRAFLPTSDKYIIMSGDYSQIELRVLAHISKDEKLIEAFKNKEDIHRRTASEVLGIPQEEVTSLERSRAKAVNFGIIYGLSDFGLARDLKISRREAKNYIDNYFERYKDVKKYLENAVQEGKEIGYVKTLMNRIRYIPEIKSSNRNVRMFGERLAMNTPIQGSAADIIKIAMVRVYKRLESEGLKSKLILQVHDELILDAYKDEADYVKELLKYEMENAVKLSVPMVVDINSGCSWYDAK